MGWEDIDGMSTANLRDELLTLLNKELEYSIPRGGMDNEPPSLPTEEGDSPDALRRNICQWNYECVDYFLLDREVVYVSMHYFDRYLARQTSQPSTMLSHLLALSSLYVACKLHGATTESPLSPPASCSGNPPTSTVRLRLQDFCNMSRGAYCPQMLQEMELSLLTNLEWKLHPPTPTDFLIRFVKMLSLSLKDDGYGYIHAADVDNIGKGWSVFEVARYQIELAVYSPELCQRFPPSKIALAATLNAMDSKIVRTKRTIIPSRIQSSFLQRVEFLGGAFSELDVDGEDMAQARTMLKKLCSKTIVLPGQIADDAGPSSEVSFMPIPEQSNSFEYELPEVKFASGASTSPVSVATDRF